VYEPRIERGRAPLSLVNSCCALYCVVGKVQYDVMGGVTGLGHSHADTVAAALMCRVDPTLQRKRDPSTEHCTYCNNR